MKRKPTFIEALVPLLGMVLLLGIGYGKYGLPIQFLLIVALLLHLLSPNAAATHGRI